MAIGERLWSEDEIKEILRKKGIDPESTAGKQVRAQNFYRVVSPVEVVRPDERIFAEHPDAQTIDPVFTGLRAELTEMGHSFDAAHKAAELQLRGSGK